MKIIIAVLLTLLAIILSYALLLIIASLFIDGTREYDTHSGFYRGLLNSITAVFIFCANVKLEVGGMDKLPEGRFLLISNHRSQCDPLVTWFVLRNYDVAFISKPSNLKIPFLGNISRKCCFMAIDRENPREAYKTVLRAAGLLKRDVVSVCVYPEGTRSKTCELLPFHTGVMKIAQKAEVPIVVMTVEGTEKVRKNFPFRKTVIKIDFIKVISSEYIKDKNSMPLGNELRGIMLEKLKK